MMIRVLGRLSHWLQQAMAADERYICGACDDRFAGRGEGIIHVMRCHPEYSVVLGDDASAPDWRPVAEPCPTRKVGTAARPLMPAAG